MSDVYRCDITGNPCGTDTRPVRDGKIVPCRCDSCHTYSLWEQIAESLIKQGLQPGSYIVALASFEIDGLQHDEQPTTDITIVGANND